MRTDAVAGRRELVPVALLPVASDRRLLEDVCAGSELAFEAIFDRHHRAVLTFCRQMLGSADEAEDVAQLTFLVAYRSIVGAELPRALRPWLYGIARHRCLSALRLRRERPVETVPERASDHLDAELTIREDLRTILDDVALLPPDQRAALVLAKVGGVSYEEIAQILECPRKKVKALVFQARASLVASRAARETPCAEIREQLSTLRNGALRRTTLRRHLRDCPSCRAFRDELATQRRGLRVLLPLVPGAGLKRTILGGIFGPGAGGAGGTALSAGALASGGLVAVALATVAIDAGGIVAPDHSHALAPKVQAAVPAAPAPAQRAMRATAPLRRPTRPERAALRRPGRRVGSSAPVDGFGPAPERPVQTDTQGSAGDGAAPPAQADTDAVSENVDQATVGVASAEATPIGTPQAAEPSAPQAAEQSSPQAAEPSAPPAASPHVTTTTPAAPATSQSTAAQAPTAAQPSQPPTASAQLTAVTASTPTTPAQASRQATPADPTQAPQPPEPNRQATPAGPADRPTPADHARPDAQHAADQPTQAPQPPERKPQATPPRPHRDAEAPHGAPAKSPAPPANANPSPSAAGPGSSAERSSVATAVSARADQRPEAARKSASPGPDADSSPDGTGARTAGGDSAAQGLDSAPDAVAGSPLERRRPPGAG